MWRSKQPHRSAYTPTTHKTNSRVLESLTGSSSPRHYVAHGRNTNLRLGYKAVRQTGSLVAAQQPLGGILQASEHATTHEARVHVTTFTGQPFCHPDLSTTQASHVLRRLPLHQEHCCGQEPLRSRGANLPREDAHRRTTLPGDSFRWSYCHRGSPGIHGGS